MPVSAEQQTINILLDICTSQQLDLFAPIAQRIAARGNDPLTLVALGKVNSGKSSLLNRLAGFRADELLPVWEERVTARMTELLPGPTQALFRIDAEGSCFPIDLPTFRDLARARGDAALVEGTARLRAELPSLVAYGGLRLVDAPGFESLTQEDEVWVRDYLPEADVLLYCQDATIGLRDQDLARLRELSGNDPAVGGFSRIKVLLTKADHFSSSSAAAAKLEEARNLLLPLGMSPDQVQLLSVDPEKEIGLETLEQWIHSLRHSGAKGQRIRRQTESLGRRIKEELAARMVMLHDPAKLAEAQASLEARRFELEAAITRIETQAYQQSRLAMPRAAARFGDGLADFYARAIARLQTLTDIDQARDFHVRFHAIREGDAALQAAWLEAIGYLAEPILGADLASIGLPGMDGLDSSLLIHVPGGLLTALEWVGDALLVILTFGTSEVVKEGARSPMWARKLTKAFPEALKPMAKFSDWVLKKAPVLAPLLKSVRELASDHVKNSLMDSLRERSKEAGSEAAGLLQGVPELFLESAQLAGSLRQEQDAALARLLEEARTSENQRQAALSGLRSALAELEVQGL